MQIKQFIMPQDVKKLEIKNESEITGHSTLLAQEQIDSISDKRFLKTAFEKCNFIDADDIHHEYVSVITKILNSSSKLYKDTLLNPEYFEINEKQGFRHDHEEYDEIETFLVSTEGIDVNDIFYFCFHEGLIIDEDDAYRLTEKGEHYTTLSDYQVLNSYLLYQLRDVLAQENILVNYSLLLLAVLSQNHVRSTDLEDIVFTALKLNDKEILVDHIDHGIDALKQVIMLIYPTINVDYTQGSFLIIGDEFKNMISNEAQIGYEIDLTFEDSYLLNEILENL